MVLSVLSAWQVPGAGQDPRRSAQRDPTIERLAKVDYFAFGGVGFALAISRGEVDYRAILSRASAAGDFETVFATGNPQAKCYALVGLRQVSLHRAEVLAATLESSRTEVPVMRGCLMSLEPMAEIVAGIRKDVYSGPLRRDVISLPERPSPPPAAPPPPPPKTAH